MLNLVLPRSLGTVLNLMINRLETFLPQYVPILLFTISIRKKVKEIFRDFSYISVKQFLPYNILDYFSKLFLPRNY